MKQRMTVRVLVIVPMYAVFSWWSLVFHKEALFFDTVRDVYEALVIYFFLTLILVYCGGELQCCYSIAQMPGSIQHPWPLCCLPALQLGSKFLRKAKRYTLQFVVVKPVFAVASLIMLGFGYYDDWRYQVFLLTIYNISYTLALYWLVLFC